MAAFETTPVAFSRADQPIIVQRFLETSERFLFHPHAAALVELRAPLRCAGVLHDESSICPPSTCKSQPGEQARAAA